MNTISELFNTYGWQQIKQNQNNQNQNNQYIYIKSIEKRLDEFRVEHNSDIDTYTITIPLVNSDYLYKNTITNIADVETYLAFHLGGMPP